MKRFTIFLICALALLSASSCKKTSGGVTEITYYPVLALNGDDFYHVNKGSTWTDPGYAASLNGKDVTDQVEVSPFNTNKSGIYTITYKVTNQDGFSATASREVFVTDNADPMEGIYETSAKCYRDASGTIETYGKDFQILIYKDDSNNYKVDDLFGGYYAQHRGYGGTYAMGGTIAVNGADVTLVDSYIKGWGDSLKGMTDGNYNAATSTFSWVVEYSDSAMFFHVTMTKTE